MTVAMRALMVVTLLASLTACAGKQLTNDNRRAIHAWLTCDECTGAERATVSSIGGIAIGELDQALKGPSAGQLSVMRRKFGTSFRIADMGTRAAPLDSATYDSFRTANYVANYQKRAATALADIGGDAARRSLDAAIADSAGRKYRSDVIRVIKLSRSRLDALTYNGTIAPYRTPFADTVKISAPPNSHFAGQERVVIEDSLFPPTQIPAVVVGDKIIFLSVAPVGLHMVSVIRPNMAVDKIPMFVTSVYDLTDRTMATCGATDIPCMIDRAPRIDAGHTPSPPSFPLVLRGTPADSLDFFRILNPSAAATPVTVVVDWVGSDLVDLIWKNCATYTQEGQAAHGNNTRHVQTSAQVPGSGCLAIQVSIAGGAGPAYGKLVVSSP